MSREYIKNTGMQGFTLVELSIAIIIIGFLLVGITAGTSLIKQAETSSVITDLQSFQTSYNNFIIHYNAVPGDMNNASSYFANCANTNSNCNGNGNGLIEFKAGLPDESYSAWRQLSLANMISAGIGAIPNGWTGVESIGSTVPISKVTGAGYEIVGPNIIFATDNTSNAVSPWNDGTTNAVFIAKISAANGLGNAALLPLDAFNIDQKIDDGSIVGGSYTGGSSGNFRTITGVDAQTAGTPCVTGGAYNVTTSNTLCVSGLALNN